MKVKDLKNKVGFQINFLLHSDKSPESTIEDIIQIAVDYHIEKSELVKLKAIQDYLLERGSNDEEINTKIRNYDT